MASSNRTGEEYVAAWENAGEWRERERLAQEGRDGENAHRIRFQSGRETDDWAGLGTLDEHGLLPLFDEAGAARFTERIRPPVGKEGVDSLEGAVLFPRSGETDDTPPMVESLRTFRKQFDVLFAGGLLACLDWSNVIVAGGSVTSALAPQEGSAAEVRQRYLKQASDLDLFIYGLQDPAAANAKLVAVYEALCATSSSEMVCFRSAHAVTMVSGFPDRHVQVVLRLYSSRYEVLAGFDVDSACFAFDGSQVWTTCRGHFALVTGRNVVDMSRRSPSYESRLAKYGARGFEVLVPGLDRSRVDPNIFERPWPLLQGLARLLVLERLRTPEDREAFRRRGLSSTAESSSALMSKSSNYETVHLPWGADAPGAKQLMRAARLKDRMLNSQYLRSGRPFFLHPCFFGTASEVLLDRAPGDPKVPDDADPDLLAKYVRGPLTWLSDNPGQQQVGSFNPITGTDWTRGAMYNTSSNALCAAANSGQLDAVHAALEACKELEPDQERRRMQRDVLGRSPLHLAIMAGHVHVARVLLDEAEADAALRLPDGRNALHLTLQYECTGALFEQVLANVAAAEARCKAFKSAQTPHSEECLPPRDVSLNVVLGHRDSQLNLTPFQLALKLGHLAAVRAVLKVCPESAQVALLQDIEAKDPGPILEAILDCGGRPTADVLHAIANRSDHHECATRLAEALLEKLDDTKARVLLTKVDGSQLLPAWRAAMRGNLPLADLLFSRAPLVAVTKECISNSLKSGQMRRHDLPTPARCPSPAFVALAELFECIEQCRSDCSPVSNTVLRRVSALLASIRWLKDRGAATSMWLCDAPIRFRYLGRQPWYLPHDFARVSLTSIARMVADHQSAETAGMAEDGASTALVRFEEPGSFMHHLALAYALRKGCVTWQNPEGPSQRSSDHVVLLKVVAFMEGKADESDIQAAIKDASLAAFDASQDIEERSHPGPKSLLSRLMDRVLLPFERRWAFRDYTQLQHVLHTSSSGYTWASQSRKALKDHARGLAAELFEAAFLGRALPLADTQESAQVALSLFAPSGSNLLGVAMAGRANPATVAHILEIWTQEVLAVAARARASRKRSQAVANMVVPSRKRQRGVDNHKVLELLQQEGEGGGLLDDTESGARFVELPSVGDDRDARLRAWRAAFSHVEQQHAEDASPEPGTPGKLDAYQWLTSKCWVQKDTMCSVAQRWCVPRAVPVDPFTAALIRGEDQHRNLAQLLESAAALTSLRPLCTAAADIVRNLLLLEKAVALDDVTAVKTIIALGSGGIDFGRVAKDLGVNGAMVERDLAMQEQQKEQQKGQPDDAGLETRADDLKSTSDSEDDSEDGFSPEDDMVQAMYCHLGSELLWGNNAEVNDRTDHDGGEQGGRKDRLARMAAFYGAGKVLSWLMDLERPGALVDEVLQLLVSDPSNIARTLADHLGNAAPTKLVAAVVGDPSTLELARLMESAIRGKQHGIAEHLLSLRGPLLNAECLPSRLPPLLLGERCQDLDTITMMARLGADPVCTVCPATGDTILHAALKRGFLWAVQVNNVLTAICGDAVLPKLLGTANREGLTPLMLLFGRPGDLETLDRLCNNESESIFKEHMDLLLARSADNSSLLHVVAANSDDLVSRTAALRFLLEHLSADGQDLLLRENANGATPIDLAVAERPDGPRIAPPATRRLAAAAEVRANTERVLRNIDSGAVEGQTQSVERFAFLRPKELLFNK